MLRNISFDYLPTGFVSFPFMKLIPLSVLRVLGVGVCARVCVGGWGGGGYRIDINGYKIMNREK